MSADDPTLFDDPQATLRMPRPGGQATVVMPRPGADATVANPLPAQPHPPQPRVDLQRLVAGVNPLLTAAGTLLALVSQLRMTTSHDDPVRLRHQLLQAVADFEAAAAASGVPRTQVGAARYVLCTFIDEVISQTPWGAAGSAWAERGLLQEFHEERSGAQKSFELLDRLGQEPSINADLLQLFYVCLQLGFEGRYRGEPRAREQLDAIAARILEVTHSSASAAQARTLAEHWKGVDLRVRGGAATLPLWVLFAVGAGALLALHLALRARMDAVAQPLLREVVAAPLSLAAPQPATPAAHPRLGALLQSDVAGGAIALSEDSIRSVVRIPADTLFVPGTAQIDARQAPLLARIARALAEMPGQGAVIGHTDDAAPSSLQFESNWHLSRARAEAVQAALVAAGVRAGKLRHEGRADAQPLDRADSDAARARNRRIEVEWQLPRPEP